MSPSATKSRLLLTAERGPVPLDPDGIYEPMLNVGQLGKGSIDAPVRAKVGDRISVSVAEFTPGTRAIFRLDGAYVGGDTIDDRGDGSRTFTVPATASELREMTVSNGQKSVTALIDINSLVKLDVTSGPVGQTVNVRLRGFGNAESVVIWFDTGASTRSMVRVSASVKTGSADTSFVVPASTDGKHRVSAVGNKGSSTYTSFATNPSASVITGTPEPGTLVRLQYLGYVAGEGIDVWFDAQEGPSLGGATASSTGSGSIAVRIPVETSNGQHYLWVIGNAGNRVRVALNVAGAGVPTPDASVSPSPSVTPGPTEALPTESPPNTATVEPTEGPTDVPTETTTETSTPEQPTVLPSETATTKAPSETATGES